MIDFSKKIKTGFQPLKINPIEIYDTLDRKSETGPLRPTQEYILNLWNEFRRNDKDAIIKLHTGAGKTLIGLLIAQSYINNNEGPVLYVCPNIYLMQQTCAEALKFGIPFCFINKDEYVLPSDFISSKKILITYVQKVFNGLSIFGIGNSSMHIGAIILDDSHACIDSIAGACTITIKKENPVYNELRQLFEDDLKLQGEGTYQDLLDDSFNTFMPIPYWNWEDKMSRVVELIAKSKDDLNVKFAWPLLKNQLKLCQALISSQKIEVSPYCIPIRSFGIFYNANHRILMSATTQEDTFFIKGLGLSIDSVKAPLIDENYKWSGEKMILVPNLICENCEQDDIRKLLTKKWNKGYGVVVLTPSFDKAYWYVERGAKLANESGQNLYKELIDYKEASSRDYILALANRYDGIDLPDDSCRVLILDSIPYYDSLSDRYEELCCTESEIIRIKTIQKIEQGLGRSVRGEKDYSVILILGSDLTKYLRSASNTKLFSAQTQKQIEIGFEIVDMVKEDGISTAEKEKECLLSTINQCINRDTGWKTYYSSKMDEISTCQADKAFLYEILEKEKRAYDLALSTDIDSACSLIQEIIDISKEENEKGWYLQLLAKYKYSISKSEANTLQISAFKNNNQLLKPLTGISYNRICYTIDDNRIENIRKYFNRFSNFQQLIIETESMLSSLSFGVEAEVFERAMQKLGELLGYVSQRPDKTIRKGPDNLWCVGINKYIMIECKSEVLDSRISIKKSEAGQMEEHCAWFESEYGNATVEYVMIIPINKLAEDAYFSHNVRIMKKRELNKLKSTVRSFINEFKDYNLKSITSERIQKYLEIHTLGEHDILNSYVVESKCKSK